LWLETFSCPFHLEKIVFNYTTSTLLIAEKNDRSIATDTTQVQYFE